VNTLGRYLEGFVSTAKDGEPGLQLAANKHPALILLDLCMPGMGGYEVMDLRREKDMGDIPAIMLTATGSGESIHEG